MMKTNILVLGAGLVAKPLVRHLLEHSFNVVVATRTVDRAEALLDGHRRGRAVELDLTRPADLDGLIGAADLVISLVPYTFHVQIARRCLALGKHLVTTSYVSNEMRELGAEAEKKGLLFLNEIGLDPGIDHMSAMRVIHGARKKGGKVLSFRSYCGGLPAPDANDNPWGYKFSWSPRGVLLAGRNSARWLEGGKTVDTRSEDLFSHHWPVMADEVGTLEGYPNRDSLQYTGLYKLDDVQTMFRGTLRYPGWCEMMKGLVDLGWLNLVPPKKEVKTLGGHTASLIGLADPDPDEAELKLKVARRIGVPADGETMARLEWAGLLADVRAPQAETYLDVLSAVLQRKLAYKAMERDMIVLMHEFEIEAGNGARQIMYSTLVDYGIPGGDSAMSRTVSLPCAIASRLILTGEIKASGVRIPVTEDIYAPVLRGLEELGIVCKERLGGE
jgi:saccharopine dehydrogenase-like NADP-dependent oxidoreductase